MMTGNFLNVFSKSGVDISTPAVMLRNEFDEINPEVHNVVILVRIALSANWRQLLL